MSITQLTRILSFGSLCLFGLVGFVPAASTPPPPPPVYVQHGQMSDPIRLKLADDRIVTYRNGFHLRPLTAEKRSRGVQAKIRSMLDSGEMPMRVLYPDGEHPSVENRYVISGQITVQLAYGVNPFVIAETYGLELQTTAYWEGRLYQFGCSPLADPIPIVEALRADARVVGADHDVFRHHVSCQGSPPQNGLLLAAAVPTLSINDASMGEGPSGTTRSLIFFVTLNPPSAQPVTVAYATVGGTATVGSDFTITTGILTFTPGVTSQRIVVPLIGDGLAEPHETFSVILSDPTGGAILGDAVGLGTITNDITAFPNDPLFNNGSQWYLAMTQIPRVPGIPMTDLNLYNHQLAQFTGPYDAGDTAEMYSRPAGTLPFQFNPGLPGRVPTWTPGGWTDMVGTRSLIDVVTGTVRQIVANRIVVGGNADVAAGKAPSGFLGWPVWGDWTSASASRPASTIHRGYRGRGVRIGIIDDGLEILHEDLSASCVAPDDHRFFKLIPQPSSVLNPYRVLTTSETRGLHAFNYNHGTNMAGIIAGASNNNLGLTGVAPSAKLVSLKIYDAAGTIDDFQYAYLSEAEQGYGDILAGGSTFSDLILAQAFGVDSPTVYNGSDYTLNLQTFLTKELKLDRGVPRELAFYESFMRMLKSETKGPTEEIAVKVFPYVISNNSVLGRPGPLTRFARRDTILKGRDRRGTILVVPSGNGLRNDDNANYDEYTNFVGNICVGSVAPVMGLRPNITPTGGLSLGNLERADYSSNNSTRGACVTVCAPGGGGHIWGKTTVRTRVTTAPVSIALPYFLSNTATAWIKSFEDNTDLPYPAIATTDISEARGVSDDYPFGYDGYNNQQFLLNFFNQNDFLPGLTLSRPEAYTRSAPSADATSWASAMVTGVVALMLEANPRLSWLDIQEILIRTARNRNFYGTSTAAKSIKTMDTCNGVDPMDHADSGGIYERDWKRNPQTGLWWSHKYGAGVINAAEAVSTAIHWPRRPLTSFHALPTSNDERQLGSLLVPFALNKQTTLVKIPLPAPGAQEGAKAAVSFSPPPSGYTITHVEVLIERIQTKYRGELSLYLTSPSGMSSTLYEPHLDAGDDIKNQAFTSLHFWGEKTGVGGAWKLEATDCTPGTTDLEAYINQKPVPTTAEPIPVQPSVTIKWYGYQTPVSVPTVTEVRGPRPDGTGSVSLGLPKIDVKTSGTPVILDSKALNLQFRRGINQVILYASNIPTAYRLQNPFSLLTSRIPDGYSQLIDGISLLTPTDDPVSGEILYQKLYFCIPTDTPVGTKYLVDVIASNALGDSVPERLSITVNDFTDPYCAWTTNASCFSTEGGAPDGKFGFNDDPDHDGLNNLIEFAFDTKARVPDTAVPYSITIEDPNPSGPDPTLPTYALHFRWYANRGADAKYEVQMSNSLAIGSWDLPTSTLLTSDAAGLDTYNAAQVQVTRGPLTDPSGAAEAYQDITVRVLNTPQAEPGEDPKPFFFRVKFSVTSGCADSGPTTVLPPR
jgi:Subtilase family/Proprotein convertase P-domain/Calx-beta domain